MHWRSFSHEFPDETKRVIVDESRQALITLRNTGSTSLSRLTFNTPLIMDVPLQNHLLPEIMKRHAVRSHV